MQLNKSVPPEQPKGDEVHSLGRPKDGRDETADHEVIDHALMWEDLQRLEEYHDNVDVDGQPVADEQPVEAGEPPVPRVSSPQTAPVHFNVEVPCTGSPEMPSPSSTDWPVLSMHSGLQLQHSSGSGASVTGVPPPPKPPGSWATQGLDTAPNTPRSQIDQRRALLDDALTGCDGFVYGLMKLIEEEDPKQTVPRALSLLKWIEKYAEVQKDVKDCSKPGSGSRDLEPSLKPGVMLPNKCKYCTSHICYHGRRCNRGNNKCKGCHCLMEEELYLGRVTCADGRIWTLAVKKHIIDAGAAEEEEEGSKSYVMFKTVLCQETEDVCFDIDVAKLCLVGKKWMQGASGNFTGNAYKKVDGSYVHFGTFELSQDLIGRHNGRHGTQRPM